MHIKSMIKLTMISIIASNVLLADGINKLDAITVTANKVEENIQNVPQSITVIDEKIIEEKGITNIAGIINEIPNMLESEDGGITVNFRGLNTSLFTNNNPIVIYIDGIPTSDRMAYDVSMANVQRVEVLRGPQGTLYGKDAIGGIINIITKEPTNKHSGNIGLEYGSYNTKLSTFNINGPIIQNKLFYGLNAQYKESDGWVTNKLKNDDKASKSEDKKYGGYLVYNPTDNLSTKLTLSRYETEKNWGNYHTLPGNIPLDKFNRDGAENTSFDVPTYENTVVNSQSLGINYDFNNMRLTSVTTHRNTDVNADYDMDYGNNPAFSNLKQFNYTENNEWTQELRLSKTTDDFKWLTGLYLDDGKRDLGPYGMQMMGIEQNAISTSNSNTKAIFGQTTFALTPKLDLTLGGRYQRITKDVDLNMYALPIGTTGAPSYSLKDEKSWDTFIPKVALAYKINNNLTPYVSISKGYMPGGYNYFATRGTAADNSFDPQVSTNYEVGIKGFGDKFTFTAAVFRMDIKDIHVFKQQGMMFLTDNAKKAHSQGIEFDFNYFPTDTIEISGSAGFVDAKYDDYDAGAVKYDGERIENTPKYTANLGIAYYHPQGYYGRFDVKGTGSTTFFNSGNQKFEKQNSHIISNVKVGYRFSDFNIYAYVNNITNEEHVISYRNNQMFGIAAINDPRTIGIGLKYTF